MNFLSLNYSPHVVVATTIFHKWYKSVSNENTFS
jgi:hypothetical protein